MRLVIARVIAEPAGLPFGRSEEFDRERDARRATASADRQDAVATMSLRVEAHTRPDVRVVCALDDDAGDAVLGCAAHLAGRLGTRVRVVRATPPMPGGTPPAVRGAPVALEEDLRRQERAAEDALDEAVNAIKAAVRTEFSVEVGSDAAVLAIVAAREPAQLLVVAAGSSWQRLASSAGVPVVVVPSATAQAG